MEIYKMIVFVLLGIELFVWIISMSGTKEKIIPIILSTITIATIVYLCLS